MQLDISYLLFQLMGGCDTSDFSIILELSVLLECTVLIKY